MNLGPSLCQRAWNYSGRTLGMENIVTRSANAKGLFRSDDAADYIYNVGIKDLCKGAYKITISEAHVRTSRDEWFSIKQRKPSQLPREITYPRLGFSAAPPFFTEVPGR